MKKRVRSRAVNARSKPAKRTTKAAKRVGKPAAKPTAGSGDAIAAYARAQPPGQRAMCEQLRGMIDASLPKASSKVWHGSPVWFIEENPVVGYSTTAKSVNLLFWNGRAFGEPGLAPVGKYQAAQSVFREAGDIDAKAVSRLLAKSRSNVFDSKAFFQQLREKRKAEG